MAEALGFLEFPQTSSSKSIPSILNRKRKTQSKSFMTENQENLNENHFKFSESPMRSRSPLHSISNIPKPKILSKKPGEGSLVLRESWKRFRDSTDSEDEQQRDQPKVKIAKKTANDLWSPFKSKDRKSYQREPAEVLLSKHTSLSARMRTILLDWLIEVCEVYRLHRETFYLATDFFDRYMSKTFNIPKNKLQLIGVTCLFIASKIEEIYPPKLQEFAYVTDGACTDQDILSMELVVLKQLNWSLSPRTPNSWSKLLLQLQTASPSSSSSEDNSNSQKKLSFSSLIKPAFCGQFHSKIMHLIDLCILDIRSLNFSYASIAATAVFLLQPGKPFPSELDLDEIRGCIVWMRPFHQIVEETGYPPLSRPSSTSEDMSNYQIHSVDLTLLDRAHREAEIQDEARITSSDLEEPALMIF